MLRTPLLVTAMTLAAGQTWNGALTSIGYDGLTCSGDPAYMTTVTSATKMSDGCTCLSGTETLSGTTWYQKQCYTCNGALTTTIAITTDCLIGCLCAGADYERGTTTFPGGFDLLGAVSGGGSGCVTSTFDRPHLGPDGFDPTTTSSTFGSITGGSLEDYIAATGTCSGLATPAAEEDPCFPSSSSVRLADGTTKRLDALKEGDEIVAATDEGALTTDTVSLLSIANPDKSVATYLSLVTAANATLTVTEGHHLPVGPSCCATLKLAKDVHVGETVWVAPSGAPRPTTLTAKTTTKSTGLHSPVLTHGGFPVVDGVVTAFDSIEKVTLAKHGLAPLLAACKTTGSCDKFRSMFLHEALKYIA